MKVNDIIQFCGLPYVVTKIETNYDPYLWYCKHYTAKCFINGNEIGGAITEFMNPFQDIDSVTSGKLKSLYA